MFKTSATISAKDINQTLRKVRETEPDLKKQFIEDIRSIAKEAESPIKSGIRRVEPLSGMKNHYGVTSWNNGKYAPDATQIRVKAKAGGRSLTTSLVSIKIRSAAVSILDMAGRSRRSVGKGKRNSGLTPVVRRTADGSLIAYARRTTVEAGTKFIANLNAAAGVVKGSASRIAWPSVEQNLPQFERRIDRVIDDFYRDANRKNR